MTVEFPFRTPATQDGELLPRWVDTYVRGRLGGLVRVLDVGCGRRAELDLPAGRCRLAITGVDDEPALRARAEQRHDLHALMTGDLRTVPLRQRSLDVVHCAHVVEHIHHVELVLDRFTDALKPGGVLVLRITDRDSAYGFLDKLLPQRPRAAVWRWLRRAEPQLRALGPRPAVYEPMVSRDGIRQYCMQRGLAIVEEQLTDAGLERFGRLAPLVAAALNRLAAVSRGRLTSDYTEVAVVVHKPANRFARVI